MTSPTLAQRLLIQLGKISERADVVVQQQSLNWSCSIKRWEKVLPADMYAFYQELNGLAFFYTFRDEPDGWHGVQLLALDRNGSKTIDTSRGFYRIPRQAAKRYPEYFFQPDQIAPSTPALFFLGSDDAWGVIMTGEGEKVSFYHWDNDGYMRYLTSSFTELIERLIDRGFAHTWAYADKHPDTDAVMARLAQPAPRAPYTVRVLQREEQDEEAYRRKLLGALAYDVRDKLLRALGARDLLKADLEVKVSALAERLADEGLEDAVALKALGALGYPARLRSMELFRRRFHVGGGEVAHLEVEITTESARGTAGAWDQVVFLTRVLQGCPGVDLSAGFPGAHEALRYTRFTRRFDAWSPFLELQQPGEWGEVAPYKATYTFTLPIAQAAGLEAGAALASSALETVEDRIQPT